MVLEFFLFLLLIAGLFYRWITKSYDKWEKAGIPHDKPTFPYGNHNFFALKGHLSDFGSRGERFLQTRALIGQVVELSSSDWTKAAELYLLSNHRSSL